MERDQQEFTFAKNRYNVMGDYLKRNKNIPCPQPGRVISEAKEAKEETHHELDVNKIADAVAKALEGKIGGVNSTVKEVSVENNSERSIKEFMSDSSLEKLAESMVVQRNQSESNLGNIGEENRVNKDNKEVKGTIDLLKGLD